MAEADDLYRTDRSPAGTQGAPRSPLPPGLPSPDTAPDTVWQGCQRAGTSPRRTAHGRAASQVGDGCGVD